MTIEEFLTEHNIQFRRPGEHHHAREKWLQLDCPQCGQPGHFRLGIHESGRYSNCWTCGPVYLLQILSEATGLSKSAVVESIDFQLPNHKPVKTFGKLIYPTGVGDLLDSHLEYLRNRNFDPAELQRLWGIRATGLSGWTNMQWRIFIPIHYRDQVVSWTSRSIGKCVHVRYRSAPSHCEAVPHKNLLYGVDYCRHAVIVNEGPLDVWTIGPGAVATFGAGFSMKQVAKIAKFPIRAICFDNEPSAQKRAEQLCNLLKPFPGETYNVKLSGKDANSSPHKEIDKLRRRFLE